MLRKILSIYILLLSFSPVFGQKTGEKAETAVLLTDRSLYITGESILFSAQLFHSDGGFQGSDVLYVELVTPAGEQVAGFKYKADDNHCSGALMIPEIIVSGNYYLRAYTKLMRNLGPESYGYCPLKIVNPEKKEVLSGNGTVKDPAVRGSGAGDVAAEGSAAENELDAFFVLSEESGDHFQIALASDTFDTRKIVTVELAANLPKGDSLLHAVVSVIPSHSWSLNKLHLTWEKEESSPEKLFLAETDGLTLSGTVRFKEKRERTDPVHVNLTILGAHTNLFYPVLTDKNNRFVFTLPDLYGQHDLFISPDNEGVASELLVDYDFDGRPAALPSPLFSLTAEERKAALKMASNEKLRQYFSNATGSADIRGAEVFSDTVPFYGKPDHMVYIGDFIDLPFLADYFTELPLPLRIRNQKELKSISITGGDAGLSIFPPLLMVDYIPVYDPGELLNINPDKASRFDIVASTYIRGQRTYGGVLNVITRKNDFAGITLPSSGLFLNYQFLKPDTDNGITQQAIPDHFPDARNTLYWNPSMKVDDSRTGSFAFLTSDSEGSYLIRVTGITQNGTTYTSSTRFKVGS
jgi:hypothetical protein